MTNARRMTRPPLWFTWLLLILCGWAFVGLCVFMIRVYGWVEGCTLIFLGLGVFAAIVGLVAGASE